MKAFIGAAALIALMAGPVRADCPYPAPPEKIPDGNTATLSEMIAVKKQVSDYDTAIGVYLDCIKKETDDAIARGGDKMSDKQKQDLEHMESSRHNAAVTKLQDIADRFNEQVRVYKAKNAAKN
jgi:hypothetical protein